MKSGAFALALCGSLIVAALGASPVRAGEIVGYDEIPEAVLATARQWILDSDLGIVSRELGDDGRPVYRFYVDYDGVPRILLIGTDGELVAVRML